MKIGIAGYGRLGAACERAAFQRDNTEIAGIFSRRKVTSLFKTPVYDIKDAACFAKDIDVMILCGGSAGSLRNDAVNLARFFDTVDSFDTHEEIESHLSALDRIQKKRKGVSVVSAGWDPGLFSLARGLFSAVLPGGTSYTFWGKGTSQGHGEAVRGIAGVRNAVQYTVPKENARNMAREGKIFAARPSDMHKRVCYVVKEQGADEAEIEKKIRTMPYYFENYDTEVYFVSERDFNKNHTSGAHAGEVIRNGTVAGKRVNMDFALRIESNPDFTAGVLLTFAAGAVKMKKDGYCGAYSVFDVPVGYLLTKPYGEFI